MIRSSVDSQGEREAIGTAYYIVFQATKHKSDASKSLASSEAWKCGLDMWKKKIGKKDSDVTYYDSNDDAQLQELADASAIM
ncbi:hypothetical protein KIN20_006861 [Parelaphostrongylus tenuis]|uniref:Uncharacterized protein n=1 Tax=Parelaphostrongylus tenuis TaxID=148309 RepID=A0AAD5QJK6_PARTN|nr:hypothetical protein KIN20_006861 [Parelaphostrongylus tenuis]